MTTKSKKIKTSYTDIIGRDLVEGDFVSAQYRNTIVVAKITKFTPKMLKLSTLNITHRTEFTRYPHECTLLPRDDVTFYVLSKG